MKPQCLGALVGVLLFILSIPSFAAHPVVAIPADKQAALVDSGTPQAAVNKRLAYDMFRYIMAAQWDKLYTVASRDIINHSPNEKNGLDAMVAFMKTYPGMDKPRKLKDSLDGMVAIFSEGDMVVIAMRRELDHPYKAGVKYTTTAFDMFRIENGLIAEHWDAGVIFPKH